jgi:hypothetical protein
MSDREIKQFFKKLKDEESQDVPDFKEMFEKAKQHAKPIAKRKSRIVLIQRISVAASLLLLLTLGIWQLTKKGANNAVLEDQFAEDWIQEETIMDWESDTDELLPTEFSMNEEKETQTKSIKAPEVTQEVIQEVIAETELDSSLYKYGAISDWESPTASLMPPILGMGMSF